MTLIRVLVRVPVPIPLKKMEDLLDRTDIFSLMTNITICSPSYFNEAGQEEAVKKPMILIVDDQPETMEMFHEVLKEHFEITLARSGQEGIEKAMSIPGPDLILLDVTMPDLNGYEVCQGLMEYERCRNIPVIFLTGETDVTAETRGLEVGGSDYIRKPFNVDVALARIRTHLELKAHRDFLARRVDDLHQDLEKSEEEYLRLFELQAASRKAGNDS